MHPRVQKVIKGPRTGPAGGGRCRQSRNEAAVAAVQKFGTGPGIKEPNNHHQRRGVLDTFSVAVTLPLAQEPTRSYAELVKSQDISREAWSEKRQAAIDLEGELTRARNARATLIAQTRKEALDSLAEPPLRHGAAYR